jgi:hypothetical protein
MGRMAWTDCNFGMVREPLLRYHVSARASRRALACLSSQSGLAKSPCRGFATRVPRRCRANGSAPAFLLAPFPDSNAVKRKQDGGDAIDPAALLRR